MIEEKLLKLKDISVQYGGVRALSKVNTYIDEGEIVALMGPNGAGKSTVLKVIFGLAPITGGKVYWEEDRVKPAPHEVVFRGISYVPQGRQVFHTLTVLENLEMGGIVVKSKRELNRRIEDVLDIFPDLKSKLKTKSGALSGGQQQMLALARGLMNDPKVLLLDEPSLGLAPKIVKEVFEKVKEINQRRKTAVLVVEHNIKSLLEIADRAYVLDKGLVVYDGEAQKLVGSDLLEKVFLGKI